mgnify:FL=1
MSVPHDVARLVTLVGGSELFVQRLDTTFSEGYNNVGNGAQSDFFHTSLYKLLTRGPPQSHHS